MSKATADEFALWRERVDAVLSEALPSGDVAPQRLHSAMHHAVMLGGKRMRPLLAYASAQAVHPDFDLALVDPASAAVELVHAYSLVHDDLPSMDDDELRRGQPTVHVKYDEATAVLTGDALQTLAFEVIADAPWDATVKVSVLQSLACASGVRGMCGGQALDLDATGKQISLDQLRLLHSMKTGALIVSAVEMGALLAGASAQQLETLRDFAKDLGVAFQIRDDILDIEGDSQTLGKTAGKDVEQDKSTYPALLGLNESKALLEEIFGRMQKTLEPFGPSAQALRALAELTVRRAN